MPRKDPKGIVAGHRVAEARRIIADQHALIEKLRSSKQATLDAERSLQVYASSLKHLEDHERRIRESKPQSELRTPRPSATEGSLRKNLHSRPVLEIDVGEQRLPQGLETGSEARIGSNVGSATTTPIDPTRSLAARRPTRPMLRKREQKLAA